ncbi:MAG: alpha-2-macroglobulin family protein [Chitinophagales bacterium]|nr:alpha-2-macroglobulin family protein [Chitinophagales bacterium]
MKLRFHPALLILPIILFINGCHYSQNFIRLERTNFTGEIGRDQNLVFTFSTNMVPDSLLNKWDTTVYIQFIPIVKGKYKWTASNELTFSPYALFSPSTDFEAIFTKKLLFYFKERISLPEQNKIAFHTPYLTLTTPQIFWATSLQNPGTAETRINLNFNSPVLPAEVNKRLHIYVNQKSVLFDFLNGNTDSIIVIAIADYIGDSKGSVPIKIQIDAGLPSVGTSYKSKTKLEYNLVIPEKGKIMVTEMTAIFKEGIGQINVFTNQPLINENLKLLVSIVPAIKFSVEKIDNGFAIIGDFETDKTYSVTLSKDLQGIFGYALNENYVQNVSFGELQPSIAFANKKSIYLSAAGDRNISINAISLNKIKVSVIRIYENNILAFTRAGTEWGYYDEPNNGDYEYHDYQYYNYENYGNLISEKTYSVQSLPKNGNTRLLNLNLDDLNYGSKLKGLYVLKIQDADRQWLQQSKFISVSDIGLIVRQAKDEVYVFANSILDANPLPNVKLSFISSNNQVIQTTTTDKDGVGIIKKDEAVFGNFLLGMVTATVNDDFNFIILDNTSVETSRYEVGGSHSNDAQLDAFIYGDREIYRPGDTIHANTIVRTEDWKTPEGAPMKMKLILPSGKEYQSYKKLPDDQGAFETAFYLPATIVTGQFTIELYSGNDVLINSRKINVEEFVPDRIKVTVELDKNIFKPNDQVNARINAINLFGPPASNRNYEAELSLKRHDFAVKKFNDYNFSIQTSENIPLENVIKEGKTDVNGNASAIYSLPDYKDIGILHGNIYTTVFDETGRPVHRLIEFEEYTQDIFFGIKNFDSWVSTHQSLTFQFAALTISGIPAATNAVVEIYKHNWENVIEHSGGRYNYNPQRRDQLLSRSTINISASGGTLNFTPFNSGEYEVRILKPGTKTYVSRIFYAYGWEDTQNTSFEVSTQGEITMHVDKERYAIGDKAELLLKAPFDGKILITVEQDHIFSYFYVSTKDKAARATISILKEYVPNVYITATAIRRLNNNPLPLTVARGYMPLLIDNAENKLPVTIISTADSRSKIKQTITVKTLPDAELTIAVVDEGILQLRNTASPDPFHYFYQQKALEVTSFDLYPFLFPEYRNSTLQGGDIAELNRRVNPFTIKRFNLVALWSGIKKSDASGNVDFDIYIPQFSGSLRVMAVAYKDRNFGSSEKIIKVADPIVISTALPRFLSPGDTLNVPVTLSNTTVKNTNVTAEILVSGPLKVSRSTTQSVSLNATSETRSEFSIFSNGIAGEGSVTINVNGAGEKFSDKTNISIRPASTLQRQTGSGSIEGGQSQTLHLRADMIASSMDAKLVVSRSLLGEFAGDLRYLLQYPYGCAEQIISSAFPQLYYRDLAKASGQDNKAIQHNPDYNVQQAIKKIEAMQLYNGAVSYWPASDVESWWCTAYAAHFLQEAGKAGFDINQDFLERMYSYLQFKIKSRETELYYYQDARNITQKKTIAKKEIPYSLWVLALSGRFDQSAMNYYKAHEELLTLDEKYMLSSAYAVSGSQSAFNDLLPAAFAGETSLRALGGSFYSPVRDEAIALLVLQEADPDNQQIGIMSRHLIQKMKSASYLSTQDRAFALLALGKLSKKTRESTVTASISSNGKLIGDFNGNDLAINQGLVNQVITIQSSGSGTLYYFWEVNGINTTGSYKPEDNFLKARKQFFDRAGKQVNPAAIHQNDLIVVKLTLQALDYKGSIDNVAMTDLLPAGFEIENPRISAIPDLSWIKDETPFDYIDIRDDRITYFATATAKEKNFYYVVRAVSKGVFHMGPVSADAMYNGEYHSYNGASTITVK